MVDAPRGVDRGCLEKPRDADVGDGAGWLGFPHSFHSTHDEICLKKSLMGVWVERLGSALGDCL